MPNSKEIDRPFLGRGWSFPLRLHGGDFATAVAEKDIEQSIRIILETAPGERVMRPDFGVGLQRMVFSPMNYSTLSVLQFRIEQGLMLWEPRIDVQQVKVRPDQDQPGRLFIDIRYRVRESNSIGNYVYPFYLTEDRQS
ncbi:GPW/gp25 family protein [Zavarzinella formosa]|uniref:GPW/gp25 family protein n=1 Tax=Zavarzinella formosa TaxID=360055 RepID=UPI0003766E06|nr:GPW/gp25 family protein [Zavarzinella formosa]